MEINKSHFGTMTNIIIDAAYALRSRLHLLLHHINLRLIFTCNKDPPNYFGTNNMVINSIYMFVYYMNLSRKIVDSQLINKFSLFF
jgi:hypothetical protein